MVSWFKETMLTKKEELTIEYVLQGFNKGEAVFKAFDCKDMSSASALATKLFKKEEVKNRLSDKLEKRDEKTAEISADFVELVKKSIPLQSVVDKLKTQLESKDGRTVDNAIDKYIKIIGGYKDTTSKALGLFEKISGLEE